MIDVVTNNLIFNSHSKMVRFHILLSCYELNDIPEHSELDVLEYLYQINGITDKDSNNAFIEHCVKENFRGSAQSVRNVLSKYTDMGLLVKPKNSVRHFKDLKLPSTLSDVFVLKYFITNLDINANKSR